MYLCSLIPEAILVSLLWTFWVPLHPYNEVFKIECSTRVEGKPVFYKDSTFFLFVFYSSSHKAQKYICFINHIFNLPRYFHSFVLKYYQVSLILYLLLEQYLHSMISSPHSSPQNSLHQMSSATSQFIWPACLYPDVICHCSPCSSQYCRFCAMQQCKKRYKSYYFVM